MQTKSLTVEMRDERGKGAARKVRAKDRIPGVVYGEGQPARPVTLDRKAFELLVRSGNHHGILDVSFASGHEPVKALVREVQVHPVSREYVHVDLQRISMQQRVRLEVPIVLSGKPEGVKTQGGILEHNLRNIEVECLPADIPTQIEVDVSALTLGKTVHVSDLRVPGVVLLAHPETSVATVSMPAAERAAEEAAAPTAEATAPVEGEAKPAAEGGKPEAKPAKEKDAKDKESKGGKS